MGAGDGKSEGPDGSGPSFLVVANGIVDAGAAPQRGQFKVLPKSRTSFSARSRSQP